MKILLLGGTIFLGRHLVDAALASGHHVTLFNRGQHNPDLYAQLERLRGDRDGDLAALRDGRWDVAIDTCGYVPRLVSATATLLAGTVDHYTFISSISVFADFSRPGLAEDGALGLLQDPGVEEVNGETYGPLKALCEQAAEAAMPGRVLTIRPGLIVGPHDPSDRFTYWPQRVARGGEVLVPGHPARLIQFIDARDLAEWILRLIEERRTGIYNADGPGMDLTMSALMEECQAVSDSDARFTWVGERYLLDAGVTPWIELPLWVPEDEQPGFFRINCSKALAAGLTFRALSETVHDTLEWDRTRQQDVPRKAGLAPDREMELLRGWRRQA